MSSSQSSTSQATDRIPLQAKLRCKQALLTYSRCNGPITPDNWEDVVYGLIQRLQTLAGGLTQWCAVLAPHADVDADGRDLHVHLALKFANRPGILLSSFDLLGVHPNVKTGGSKSAWKNFVTYCKNGQDCYRDVVPLVHSKSTAQLPDDYLVLAAAGKCKEAFEVFSSQHPVDVIRIGPKTVKARLRELQPKRKRLPKFALSSFKGNEDLEKALKVVAPDGPKNRSIILIGPSGFGKTNYIKSWVHEVGHRMLWVAGSMDAFRYADFDPDSEDPHTIIVCDDMCFLREDIPFQLAMVDTEDERRFGSEMHVRYRCCTVPENIPRIFMVNSIPFDMSLAKIASRCIIVNLRRSLIDGSAQSGRAASSASTFLSPTGGGGQAIGCNCKEGTRCTCNEF